MKTTNISSESYEQITITSKLQSPESVAFMRESGQSNLCANPFRPEITLMDNNETASVFSTPTETTPKDCQVVIRYNPLTDKTFKRYVCSSEGCNNESPLFYLDGHGKCPDCQIIEARDEYIQTVKMILEEEGVVC